MAQYGDQYNHAGNQEFGGNMVGQTGKGVGVGATGMQYDLSGEKHHHPEQLQQHGQQEKLHRTGSSSSSSSEDDGEGGRRKKKGLTGKIMEKIPGVGHKEPQATMGTNTMPGGVVHSEVEHGEEKKGIMDKIKEKLPGVN